MSKIASPTYSTHQVSFADFVQAFKDVRGKQLTLEIVKEIRKQLFALRDPQKYLGLGHLRKLVTVLEPNDHSLTEAVLRTLTDPELLNLKEVAALL